MDWFGLGGAPTSSPKPSRLPSLGRLGSLGGSFGRNLLKEAGIQWCAITRDGITLVQWCADVEDMTVASEVKALAAKILEKPATPGFEYATVGSGLNACHYALKLHVHESDPDVVWAFNLVRDASYPLDRAKRLVGELALSTQAVRTTPLWREGGAGAAQGSFSRELQRWLARGNTALQGEPTTEVAEQLEKVNKIMHDNIELLLQRQEKLDALSRKGQE